MKLRTIGTLLLIAALIGGSVGVVAAEDVDEDPNCDDCTALTATIDGSVVEPPVKSRKGNGYMNP
jgi:hypothetical protein